MAKIATLANIGDGLADDLFRLELDKVLKNIANPKTSATAAREINISLKIKPDDQREMGTIEINSKAKLAPISGKKALLFFSKDDDGKVRATTANPKQETLGLEFAAAQEKING